MMAKIFEFKYLSMYHCTCLPRNDAFPTFNITKELRTFLNFIPDIEIDYSTSTTSATEDEKKLSNQREGRKTFIRSTLELVKISASRKLVYVL